jgi:hypothetical protein
MLIDVSLAVLSACFFVIVGTRLLALGFESGQTPEKLLGVYFAASGLAYLGWQVPVLLSIEQAGGPIDLVAWTLYSVGVVPFLLFVQQVFRPDANWARALVGFGTIAIVAGLAMCVVEGHDYYRIENPWYLSLWIGYTTPCVWMSVEALLGYTKASRRVRIGLSDRIVANRYLLFGCFGVFQTFACVTDLFLTAGFAANPVVNTGLGSLLSALELAGIVVLFFAFFPPQFFLRWIEAPVTSST